MFPSPSGDFCVLRTFNSIQVIHFTLDLTLSGPNYKEQRAEHYPSDVERGRCTKANWRPLYHLDIATPDQNLESSQASPKNAAVDTGLVADNDWYTNGVK